MKSKRNPKFTNDGNTLEVGTNGKGEVVVNHPQLAIDENGVGHIVFSPEQAIGLADLLVKHAGIAYREAAGHTPKCKGNRGAASAS